jgi:hypothetical protein
MLFLNREATMNQPSSDSATPSLFGEEPKPLPPAKAQSVLDQFVGIFSEPAEVFKKLREAPGWVGAFVSMLVAGLIATLVWAAKVDVEAAARQKFEVMEQAFHINIPPQAMDQALEKAATQGRPFIQSSLGVVLMVPLVFLILAGILFALVKLGGEDDQVTFKHAWAATVVHSLAMLPITILAGIMCLLRNVGGAASYASLAPSALVFWVNPENPWIRGLLSVADPFYLFSFVTLYFAARYTLRLKLWAIAVLLGIAGFFGFIFHILGGMF